MAFYTIVRVKHPSGGELSNTLVVVDFFKTNNKCSYKHTFFTSFSHFPEAVCDLTKMSGNQTSPVLDMGVWAMTLKQSCQPGPKTRDTKRVSFKVDAVTSELKESLPP